METTGTVTIGLAAERWVCLEVFGHRQHMGRLTDVEQFGARFARIEMLCPRGHLVGAPTYAGAAIFSITDISEEDARRRNQYACPHADCRAPVAALSAHDEESYEDDGACPPDSDPHGLLEYAVAFRPTVDIGFLVAEVLLAQNDDESFSFRGPRAEVLGLADERFDNPEEAMVRLREVEAEHADDQEMAQLLERAAKEEQPESPMALIDEIDRIFPGEPGRARELLGELRRAVELLEVGEREGSCEGCGCSPCAGVCPGRMTAPTAAGAGSQVTPEDATALLAAARVLVSQNVGDYVYSVRESEALGWDGPKVTAWSNASVTLAEMVKKYPEAPAPAAPVPEFSDGTCPDCRTDCASWVALGEGCKRPAAVAAPADPTDDVVF